jgi:hypothetical protein
MGLSARTVRCHFQAAIPGKSPVLGAGMLRLDPDLATSEATLPGDS